MCHEQTRELSGRGHRKPAIAPGKRRTVADNDIFPRSQRFYIARVVLRDLRDSEGGLDLARSDTSRLVIDHEGSGGRGPGVELCQDELILQLLPSCDGLRGLLFKFPDLL